MAHVDGQQLNGREPRSAPEPQPARIIYVEDDDLMATVVKDLLTGAGHLIGVVAHGTLAYETIAFKKPDLVILDRALPGMQGIDILRRLRAVPETYLLPVLMLTGKGGATMVEEGLEAGADRYLVKPFNPDALVTTVAEVLRNSLYKRPAPKPSHRFGRAS